MSPRAEPPIPAADRDRLVSVVIPTYNNADYVRDAVDSVRAQSYRPLEIIVVDDGSTDETPSVLAPYLDRVVYVRIANQGSAHARNVGLDLAHGAYVAFLDADDLWEPEKTALQIDYLVRHPGFAMVYTDKLRIDAGGSPIAGSYEQPAFPQGNIFLELYRNNVISTSSSVLVRKTSLDRAGRFDERSELRNCQDYELWLRIADRFQIGAIESKLVRYRVHGRNIHKETGQRYRGMVAALRSAESLPSWQELDDGLKRSLHRERFARLHKSFGSALFHENDITLARHCLKEAWLSNPRDVQAAALLILSSLPRGAVLRLKRWRKSLLGHPTGWWR